MKQANRRYLSLTLATLGGRRVSLDLERYASMPGQVISVREIMKSMQTVVASDVSQTLTLDELFNMPLADFGALVAEIAQKLTEAAQEVRDG